MAPITGAVLSKIMNEYMVEYPIRHPRYQPFTIIEKSTSKTIVKSSNGDDFTWNVIHALAEMFVNIDPIVVPQRFETKLYVENKKRDFENMSSSSMVTKMEATNTNSHHGHGFDHGQDHHPQQHQQQQHEQKVANAAASFYQKLYSCLGAMQLGDYSAFDKTEQPTYPPSSYPSTVPSSSPTSTLSQSPTAALSIKGTEGITTLTTTHTSSSSSSSSSSESKLKNSAQINQDDMNKKKHGSNDNKNKKHNNNDKNKKHNNNDDDNGNDDNDKGNEVNVSNNDNDIKNNNTATTDFTNQGEEENEGRQRRLKYRMISNSKNINNNDDDRNNDNDDGTDGNKGENHYVQDAEEAAQEAMEAAEIANELAESFPENEAALAAEQAAEAAKKAAHATSEAAALAAIDGIKSGDGDMMTSVISTCFSDGKYGIRYDEYESFDNRDGNDDNRSGDNDDIITSATTTTTTHAYVYIDGSHYYRLNLTAPYLTVSTVHNPLPTTTPVPEGKGDFIDISLAIAIIGGLCFGIFVMLHHIRFIHIASRFKYEWFFHPTKFKGDHKRLDGLSDDIDTYSIDDNVHDDYDDALHRHGNDNFINGGSSGHSVHTPSIELNMGGKSGSDDGSIGNIIRRQSDDYEHILSLSASDDTTAIV
jgi:hypothetical protein